VEGKPGAKRGRIPGVIANPRLHRAIYGYGSLSLLTFPHSPLK